MRPDSRTRTIIIPRNTINPNETNIIEIPPGLQQSHMLIARQMRGPNNPLTAQPLPHWHDSLSTPSGHQRSLPPERGRPQQPQREVQSARAASPCPGSPSSFQSSASSRGFATSPSYASPQSSGPPTPRYFPTSTPPDSPPQGHHMPDYLSPVGHHVSLPTPQRAPHGRSGRLHHQSAPAAQFFDATAPSTPGGFAYSPPAYASPPSSGGIRHESPALAQSPPSSGRRFQYSPPAYASPPSSGIRSESPAMAQTPPSSGRRFQYSPPAYASPPSGGGIRSESPAMAATPPSSGRSPAFPYSPPAFSSPIIASGKTYESPRYVNETVSVHSNPSQGSIRTESKTEVSARGRIAEATFNKMVSQAHAAQDQTYAAPNQTYAAPNQTYAAAAPNQTYAAAAPDQTYAAPPAGQYGEYNRPLAPGEIPEGYFEISNLEDDSMEDSDEADDSRGMWAQPPMAIGGEDAAPATGRFNIIKHAADVSYHPDLTYVQDCSCSDDSNTLPSTSWAQASYDGSRTPNLSDESRPESYASGRSPWAQQPGPWSPPVSPPRLEDLPEPAFESFTNKVQFSSTLR